MKDVEKYIYVQNGIIWHGTTNISITSNKIGHSVTPNHVQKEAVLCERICCLL